ncbi:MAG: aldose 1-epimerase family protein [Gaiellaceae bacterium]
MTQVAPSGEQITIEHGDQQAVVVGVGAGLRVYTVRGRDLVNGYCVDEMATAGRGQVLIPWPNRLQDGKYEFEGRGHQLPLTEPEHANAIHGLVRWSVWSVADHEPERVVMTHRLHPRPGYPFTLDLSIEYTLSDHGLSVRTTATNVGHDRCPYGCGAHPYLSVGTETVDAAVLQAPARTVLQADGRGIPTGATPVAGTDYDFREPRAIAATRLDHGFTDLERGEDGLARVELTDPETEAALALWVDESYPYLMLFTGDLPDIGRRGLAVEPMTCAPNAFRSGEGLIVLEAGGSVTSTWGISPTAR